MAYSVLILDDDADFNSLLTDIFEQADYIVTSLEDPVEAVEVFTHTDYDLVVTDHKMPEMTGAEFMKRIKKIKRQVPVIMVSGYLENDTIRELISEGVGGVFLKPLNIFSLLERTAELIEESKKAPQSSDSESGASNEGVGEPDTNVDKLGFAFRSFPCKSPASLEFAERLHSLRNFKSTLSLIGEPGTHYRAICNDIRGFYEGDGEHFVYLSPDSFEAEQALNLIESAKAAGAERVTCVLLDVESMSPEQKKLAALLPKCEGLFEAIDFPIRTIFCVSGDLDVLFDEERIDEHLYILMGTAEVQVPALRNCPADIAVLAQQIVVDAAKEKALGSVPQFENSARELFRKHTWKRNYEELRATVRKVVDLSSGGVLTRNTLQEVLHAEGANPRAKLDAFLSNARSEIVLASSILLGGGKNRVADFFGTDVAEIDGILK
ncbi:sigma-54-dependent transcriptional regulator [Coraliomargarita parva]|uniref:sigma-54-dependent transcriptional regulator n=1 Tax=Coraliomargarita parva TaxID=3014050 RepID=UPI0022B41441|nr:response regulator [Coraliomargarita parva]